MPPSHLRFVDELKSPPVMAWTRWPYGGATIQLRQKNTVVSINLWEPCRSLCWGSCWTVSFKCNLRVKLVHAGRNLWWLPISENYSERSLWVLLIEAAAAILWKNLLIKIRLVPTILVFLKTELFQRAYSKWQDG